MEEKKRKTGQHGPYKVKSPGRAAALKRYREAHNWSEEAKKISQRPEVKAKKAEYRRKANLERWANWTEEERQAFRDKSGSKEYAGKRSLAKELAKKHNIELDYLSFMGMKMADIDELIETLKSLPD